MNDPQVTQLVPVERVERLIHLARGEKVLLDADLAMLYGVETKVLNRAVKRNRSRFPQDFTFQLTAEEAANLRCQIGTSSSGYGGRRYLPHVFTEQGVAMLSSVLNVWFDEWDIAKAESGLRKGLSELQPSAFSLQPFPAAPIKGSLAQFLYINWRTEARRAAREQGLTPPLKRARLCA
jgi:hypothetical protein